MNEDFERDSQKDLVYLLEAQMQEEQEFWEWYSDVHMRKPAQISVINETIKQNNESREHYTLPF